MPASLPGTSYATNTTGNPSLGTAVMFDLLSGPKGSPKDNDSPGNASTGALSTGIGFGPNVLLTGQDSASSTFKSGYIPGITKPDNNAATDSTLMYIGGGKCSATSGGAAAVVPYTAGFGIGAAGAGGTRDGGAGPVYTGFTMKLVSKGSATGAGTNIEAGPPAYVNRTGASLPANQLQFGVSAVASATVA